MNRFQALALLGAMAGVGGFVAQMLIHSDPTPGYAYFSPMVALLLGLVSATSVVSLAWRQSTAAQWLTHAATTGVILATAVYWFALVPVNGLPTTDDPAAIIAALLIHGVLPAVAIPLYLLSDYGRRRGPLWACSAALLLAAYGVVLFAVCIARGLPLPYEFVDPDVVGSGLAILFSLLSLAIHGVIGWALNRAKAHYGASREVADSVL